MQRSLWMVSMVTVMLLFAAAACQVSPGSESSRLIKMKVPTCS